MLFGRSIVICREGWYYLLVLTFVVTGSFLREVNLLLVLAGMMFFPMLLNLRAVLVSTRNLSVRRRLPQRVTAGDTFGVEVTLAKSPPFGLFHRGASRAVVAVDQIGRPSDGDAKSQAPPLLFWRLAPGQQQRQSYRCQLGQRGLYQLGPMHLSSGFPLGLIRATRRDKRQDRLVVLPRPGRLTTTWARLYQEVHFGSRASHYKQGVLEGDFHSLREWRSGDSRRRIHWRTTARRGQPVVRQFEQQHDEDLVLLVDLWHPPSPSEEDLEIVERSVSFAATIVIDICHRGNNRFYVGVSGDQPNVHGGPASTGMMHQLLEGLALAAADPADRLAELLALTYDTIPSGMTVVIVSPRSLDIAQLESAAGLWDHAQRRRHSGQIVTINAANGQLDEYFLPDSALGELARRQDPHPSEL